MPLSSYTVLSSNHIPCPNFFSFCFHILKTILFLHKKLYYFVIIFSHWFLSSAVNHIKCSFLVFLLNFSSHNIISRSYISGNSFKKNSCEKYCQSNIFACSKLFMCSVYNRGMHSLVGYKFLGSNFLTLVSCKCCSISYWGWMLLQRNLVILTFFYTQSDFIISLQEWGTFDVE